MLQNLDFAILSIYVLIQVMVDLNAIEKSKKLILQKHLQNNSDINKGRKTSVSGCDHFYYYCKNII